MKKSKYDHEATLIFAHQVYSEAPRSLPDMIDISSFPSAYDSAVKKLSLEPQSPVQLEGLLQHHKLQPLDCLPRGANSFRNYVINADFHILIGTGHRARVPEPFGAAER